MGSRMPIGDTNRGFRAILQAWSPHEPEFERWTAEKSAESLTIHAPAAPTGTGLKETRSGKQHPPGVRNEAADFLGKSRTHSAKLRASRSC